MDILAERLNLRVEDFSALVAHRARKGPFRTLVMTILSQNSTDVAAMKSFERLDAAVGVDPGRLARANVRTIEGAIAVGGLQQFKAPALKRLSQIIVGEYYGDLGRILRFSFEKARETLMDLPGVGPKTADVLLVTHGKPTIPVDTHVNRVSRRLGLAPLKGGYEQVRSSLQNLFPRSRYHQVHLLLIAHGRAYCTAIWPNCPKCPVRKYCPYPLKSKRPRPVRLRALEARHWSE